VLSSGVEHLAADQETARVQDLAADAYPFLRKIDPKLFTEALAVGELAVGGLLLAPIVPSQLAGVAVTGFAGGLVRLYARTPGMRWERSVFPAQHGLGYAGAWLAAIGIALFIDDVLERSSAERESRV
jgi:hypothetical protein